MKIIGTIGKGMSCKSVRLIENIFFSSNVKDFEILAGRPRNCSVMETHLPEAEN